MLKKLFPDTYVDSIHDIDYKKLYEEGKRGLIFDIDNTLVPYDVAHPDDKIITLFEELKALGFKICLASNNNKDRVIKFNERLKLIAIHKALKPFRRNLRKAMYLMKTKKEETVIIGDQIFTDVLGGNRLGIKTILVVPIQDKEEWITKIKRNTERKILDIYQKRSGK
ncbi:hypothetical protein EDC18_101201 [Natranaerovirga pectinivora]|uniref:YqeG family HAD IIIA-type phosphatase n=1 Tax=Natranaerovirga pectinivora TaxID=682400 RepID=A0A4R3MNQ7_9FIRM|nr:YqeG family HAD IIIA-type phosphatase [Natranaerovirga pectinivora]TCT16905.1 hypothetical protein EDC18_101201 [Natranaerovirga pectinivora]